MKKLILLGLMAGLFNACEECPPDRYTSSSAEVDNTRSLVADYLAGDWEGWLSRYGDDAKMFHNTVVAATPEEGKASLQQILSNFSSYDFSDDFEYFEMITDDKGDKWVYFWSNWSGTFSATGEELIVPVHLAQLYEDGKIKEEYGFYDLSQMIAALAAIEAAASVEEE